MYCCFVGSRVYPRVTGVGADFYPWQVAGAGVGFGFNPRVQVYMHVFYPRVMCPLPSIDPPKLEIVKKKYLDTESNV